MNVCEKQIKVFPLLGPSHYFDHCDMLAALLFPDIKAKGGKKTFFVSRSGFISFSDYNELWKPETETRKLPGNAREACRAAEDFMEQVRARFSDDQNYAIKEKLTSWPFPPASSAPRAVPVFHPRKPMVDHWLCKFTACLYPHAGADPVPVHGATIEIRVGDGNKIIGLNIHWRPFSSIGIDTALLPYNGDKNQCKIEKQEEPALVYLLESDNQKFLAPYYITVKGESTVFLPASEYSMVTDIFQKNTAGGANLYAMVNGGNVQKKFSFNWAMCRLSKVLDEGMKFIGTSSILRNIPCGMYYISLDVNDSINGQTKRLRKKLYISPDSDEQL